MFSPWSHGSFSLNISSSLLQVLNHLLLNWTWFIEEFNIEELNIISLKREYFSSLSSTSQLCAVSQWILNSWIFGLVIIKLNFRRHILKISKMANRMLGSIKRNFRHFDADSLIKLYKTMVRSQLEYAQSIWQALHKERPRVPRIQRRKTKLLPHLCWFPYPERLQQHLLF